MRLVSDAVHPGGEQALQLPQYSTPVVRLQLASSLSTGLWPLACLSLLRPQLEDGGLALCHGHADDDYPWAHAWAGIVWT